MKFSHRTGEKRSSFPSSGSSMTGLQAGSAFGPPILSTHLLFSKAARDTRAVKCGLQLHWGPGGRNSEIGLVHFHVEKLHSECRKVTNGARFISVSIRHLGSFFSPFFFSKFCSSILTGVWWSRSRPCSCLGYPASETFPSASRPVVIVHRGS
jgi:hypothetical protein